MIDRWFPEPPFKLHLPAVRELFTRWVREILPEDFANVPSGATANSVPGFIPKKSFRRLGSKAGQVLFFVPVLLKC